MDLVAVARIAVRALARNKMRSAFTMLGIIIGVGAVIAMVGVGQGAQTAGTAANRRDGFEHSVRRLGYCYAGWNSYGLGCHQDSRVRGYARYLERVSGRQSCRSRW